MTKDAPTAAVPLDVRLGPLGLKNPILAASGTFGSGEEYAGLLDVGRLGGVVAKTVTPEARLGNPPPRLVEVAGGLLNNIGLENKGVDHFIEHTLPGLRALPVCRIVSVAGRTVDEYAALSERLGAEEGVDAIELNISCPNVKEGGVEFGTSPEWTGKLVRAVRARTKRPLVAKLSPNASDVAAVARAAVDSGAEIVSLINTITGLAVDWRTRGPKLGGGTGGLSGPCVKPIALRMIHQVRQALPQAPIVGIGGIQSIDDVMEFLAVGASAVQVGTATFYDPTVSVRLVDDLPGALAEAGVKSVGEFVGSFRMGTSKSPNA